MGRALPGWDIMTSLITPSCHILPDDEELVALVTLFDDHITSVLNLCHEPSQRSTSQQSTWQPSIPVGRFCLHMLVLEWAANLLLTF